MSSLPWPIRRIARVTVELTSPLHIGAGREGDGLDAVVVIDANGLPAIPGSSLAGILRAAFFNHWKSKEGKGQAEDRKRSVFGYQVGNEGCGSRLSVSWGILHDSKNRPAEDLGAANLKDDVLANAVATHYRDHVALGHRGAASGRAKFDECHVCGGHRFTFELELIDQSGDERDWRVLLGLLLSGKLRLGGKSRRGLGAFKVVELRQASLDLTRADQFELYASHPASLAATLCPALQAATPEYIEESKKLLVSNSVVVTLTLRPAGSWFFGGGEDIDKGDNPAKLAPYRDDWIAWRQAEGDQEIGEVKTQIPVLPASGFKGALAHRVAFHSNLKSGKFADVLAKGCKNDESGHATAAVKLGAHVGENNPAVNELFGFAKDAKGEKTGQRGLAILSDWVPLRLERDWFKTHYANHVAIDRFTGGVRGSALFSETAFWKGELAAWQMTIERASAISSATRLALRSTLRDLVEGRLSIGCGSGRGNGFCEGVFQCNDAAWFDGAPSTAVK